MYIYDSLIVVTEPSVEPVTVADCTAQLRIIGTDSDTMITSLIIAARQAVEAILKRKLINTGVRAGYDRFPSVFYLPLSPASSITSMTYIDDAGDTQTVSSATYIADTESDPARIALVSGSTWPTFSNQTIGGVKVNYIVGYGATAADVPQAIKQAIITTVIDLFEHPEMEAEVSLTMNKSAMRMLNSYRNCALVV